MIFSSPYPFRGIPCPLSPFVQRTTSRFGSQLSNCLVFGVWVSLCRVLQYNYTGFFAAAGGRVHGGIPFKAAIRYEFATHVVHVPALHKLTFHPPMANARIWADVTRYPIVLSLLGTFPLGLLTSTGGVLYANDLRLGKSPADNIAYLMLNYPRKWKSFSWRGVRQDIFQSTVALEHSCQTCLRQNAF
jgi:hypothetical protein